MLVYFYIVACSMFAGLRSSNGPLVRSEVISEWCYMNSMSISQIKRLLYLNDKLHRFNDKEVHIVTDQICRINDFEDMLSLSFFLTTDL